MSIFRFSIIGAGAGGTLMAVYLKNKGFQVNLADKRNEVIEKMNGLEALTVTGKTEARQKPDLITTDLCECIKGSDVILVSTTTDAHRNVAKKIATTIKSEQIVVLMPGHLGGVLEFKNALKVSGCKGNPVVCECSDLPYACRTLEVGHTFHSGIKEKVKVASIPSENAQKVCDLLNNIFPALYPVKNVLETGLSGAGGLLHSIPCLMNLNKVELGQPFDYYMEGITPGVCKIIEAADRERIQVCKAYGVKTEPLVDHLKHVYHLEPNELYEAIQSCEPYRGIKSPVDTNHRFFQEDTLNDLVPTASLGSLLGIKTPTIDAIIMLIGIATGKDFMAEGRTSDRLGLKNKTLEEIYEYIK